MEEGLLIQQIKEGNQKAFRTLFNTYYKELLGTSINMLKDVDLAKDVVQEVFTTIWRKREDLEITSSLKPYLKRAVINRSLNAIKARKQHDDVDDQFDLVAGGMSPQGELENQDLKAAVGAGLDTLPEKCREAFVLRRIEGYTVKEIAEMMEVSPKTVENQITKGLKLMREALRPYFKLLSE